MDRQINYLGPYLKLPFQMISFATITTLFACGCIVTGIVSKHAAQVVCRTWARLVLSFFGIRLHVTGREKLSPGKRYVFFSNHQSHLDIPVLFAGIGYPICFIAKKELFQIPIFGWGMAAMGHVRIDRANARKARQSLTRGVRLLKQHRLSLVLFPEGTRSATGMLGEFKQGSFALAQEAGVAVVPVVIRKANERLPKKNLVVKPGEVYLDICDPVDITGIGKNGLAAQVRKEIEKVLERV
ncbi:MAG: lysophospholipid acyltransferase family protein [Chitinispirillaceae bacterium]|jgi:1-acyl-sn-glycerol-3-phosphate acyltransferase